jgi:hypothetical protein
MKIELIHFTWFAYTLFTGSAVYLLFTNNSIGALIGGAFLVAFIVLGGLDSIFSTGNSKMA